MAPDHGEGPVAEPATAHGTPLRSPGPSQPGVGTTRIPAGPTEDAPTGTGSEGGDARIEAVLAVLRGVPMETVGRQWSIDPGVLQRWVSQFVDAGTAQVSNRPDPAEALRRDRFLAAFAYEMRTPLSVALGWGDLLAEADGEVPDPAFGETVGRLQGALAELADRVADVELLVAAALGGLRVNRTRVPVRSTCELPDLAGVSGEGPDFEIDVDVELFARIMRDLWNASALEPEPLARRIDVRIRQPWVEVRVLRTGEPIETSVLHALFEPFELDMFTTGVTTGLYLARALTVAHGGTMGVDQDEEGAAFWVRVPHRPPLARPVGPGPADPGGGP